MKRRPITWRGGLRKTLIDQRNTPSCTIYIKKIDDVIMFCNSKIGTIRNSIKNNFKASNYR